MIGRCVPQICYGSDHAPLKIGREKFAKLSCVLCDCVAGALLVCTPRNGGNLLPVKPKMADVDQIEHIKIAITPPQIVRFRWYEVLPHGSLYITNVQCQR